MTIQPWYAVWCDQEGCIEWTDGGATRAEAALSRLVEATA